VIKAGSICLGTAKFGSPDYGFSSSKYVESFNPNCFLREVEALGIHRFDTSPRYGKSEEMLGAYIKQRETTPFVSSKTDNLSPNQLDTPQKILKSVQNSLKRLNLKKLDICFLHQNELEIISDPYVHEGLMLLKQRGLTSQVGASVYSFHECEYAIESGFFEVVQVPVSVFDLSFYNRFCKSRSSISFVSRSLLLQGILVNRDMIKNKIRQSDEVLSYLAQLDQLAKANDLSVLEMALAFMFSLKNIDRYLIGTTSIQHLQKDIDCINIELAAGTSNRICEMASRLKNWTNPRNWN